MKFGKVIVLFGAVLMVMSLISCNKAADTDDFLSATTESVTQKTDTPVTPEGSEQPEQTEITGMPVIRINTKNNVKVPNDKTTVECTVNLKCSVDKYSKEGLEATIRVRGNGSLGVGNQTGKYPYKLKFENKINVFGLGEAKAKDWVLNANNTDRTMLRNFAPICFISVYGVNTSMNLWLTPNIIHQNMNGITAGRTLILCGMKKDS